MQYFYPEVGQISLRAKAVHTLRNKFISTAVDLCSGEACVSVEPIFNDSQMTTV